MRVRIRLADDGMPTALPEHVDQGISAAVVDCVMAAMSHGR